MIDVPLLSYICSVAFNNQQLFRGLSKGNQQKSKPQMVLTGINGFLLSTQDSIGFMIHGTGIFTYDEWLTFFWFS